MTTIAFLHVIPHPANHHAFDTGFSQHYVVNCLVVLQAMGAMNKQMNLPALSNIMREFDRQNERMEMTSEMMGDAVDDAFEVCDLCIITHCSTQDKRLLVPPYQSSAANKYSHQMHALCFATYSLTSGHPVRPYALVSGTLPKHAWQCFAHAGKYMHSVLLSMPD